MTRIFPYGCFIIEFEEFLLKKDMHLKMQKNQNFVYEFVMFSRCTFSEKNNEIINKKPLSFQMSSP